MFIIKSMKKLKANDCWMNRNEWNEQRQPWLLPAGRSQTESLSINEKILIKSHATETNFVNFNYKQNGWQSRKYLWQTGCVKIVGTKLLRTKLYSIPCIFRFLLQAIATIPFYIFVKYERREGQIKKIP